MDSSGGHFDKQTNQYHCHRDSCVPIPPGDTPSAISVQKNSRPTFGPSQYGGTTSKAMMRIFKSDNETFYCGCKFNQDKTINFGSCYQPINKFLNRKKIEQEHVVPASFFGQGRSCWKKPIECKKSNNKFKGNRECCRATDPEFKKAEADLHNFKPAIGQLNASRSNKPYGIIPGNNLTGGCDFELTKDLAEPSENIRGDIARIFFYMADTWNMPLSDEGRAMYRSWSNADPVTAQEKKINKLVCEAQGNSNNFVEVLTFNKNTKQCE